MRRASVVLAAAFALAACETDDTPQEATGTQQQSPDTDAPDADAPDGDAPDSEVSVETDADAEVDPDAQDQDAAPEMLGPPSDEIGVPVAIDPMVFEGDGVVVALSAITVHTDGMELLAAVRWDPDDDAREPDDTPGGPMDAFDLDEPPASEQDLPDELLRIEVVYPDGSVASSVDDLLATAAGEEPEEPALTPFQGMGDGLAWDQQLWATPLPGDDGTGLELAVEWPEYGIDDRAELDVGVAELEDAADRVVRPWS